jgi:tetratricopeptide (TPR) repeat protein
VIIEKGYFQRESNSLHISWMGHFSFITGYDDTTQQFVWQDSYPNRCQDQANLSVVEKKGRDNLISYDDLFTEWRSYNYLFIVVYPVEQEADVFQALGPWGDSDWAAKSALQTARLETASMSGNDLFFAWFNLGTSNVAIQEYAEAASAYDRAFTVYATLSEDVAERPYRIMWYETGPYWAYFYSGRYQDVVNLADTTLSFRPYATSVEPKLEESLYWRGMAYYALGEYNQAYADMLEAVHNNPNFQAALAKLTEWGVSP